MPQQNLEETAKGKPESIVVRGEGDTLTSEPMTETETKLLSLMKDRKALTQLRAQKRRR